MSFADERQTIENRFNIEWTATPIAYDNVPFNPPANSDWVRLNIQNGDSGYRSLESTVRHTGIINVQIFTPVNKATKTSRQYADIAADIFSDQRFGDVVTDVSSISIVGDDDAWLQTNVTTPYYRDAEAQPSVPEALHTHLVLEYSFDVHNIEAEAGDFAAHEALGWIRNNANIKLDVYNGVPVFIVPDDGTNLFNLKKPLTFQDIQNLHLYNGVFGGRFALDIPDGGNGAAIMIETTQATSILNADGVTKPFPSGNNRRFRIRCIHDGNYVTATGDGFSDILLDGIGTVNVTDWEGNPQTNIVPKVLPGEFFDYEIHAQNGLDERTYLYINGILVGHPTFVTHTGEIDGNRLLYTSGSATGVNRITYFRKFGSTINTSSSELSLIKADLEQSLSLTVIIPNGTRNYSLLIDKNLNLSIGYRFNFVSQTIGQLSWSPKNETGLAATIDGYSTNAITLKGLQEFHYVNILQNGVQFISPARLERDFSRFNGYLPTAIPYTTPTLIADTPTKLVVPITVKTAKDFSFDVANSRQFLDAPGVEGRWFLIHSTATITTSVSNQMVTVETYVNGVIVEGVGVTRFMAASTDEGSLVGIGATQLSHLDYVEIFITLTSAGTVTFKRLSVTINEMVGAV